MEMRRALRQLTRRVSDQWAGLNVSPPPRQNFDEWPVSVEVVQPMGTTPHADAKQANIALAAEALSGRPIHPNEIFSFWSWLGRPTAERGFQKGRSLRDGVLVLDTGGGLCQLAGAIYFAGLQAGLLPLERHAHSVDLYTDATRYAPLGSDATVLFGFKDLRLRNPHEYPVGFEISADADSLHVRILAKTALPRSTLEFRITSQGLASVEVETWRDGKRIARDVYARPA